MRVGDRTADEEEAGRVTVVVRHRSGRGNGNGNGDGVEGRSGRSNGVSRKVECEPAA